MFFWKSGNNDGAEQSAPSSEGEVAELARRGHRERIHIPHDKPEAQIDFTPLTGITGGHIVKSVSQLQGLPHYFPIQENDSEVMRTFGIRSRQLPRKAGEPIRVHVGVAGTINLDLIGASRPDAAVLLDINQRQRGFWQEFMRVLALPDSDTPEKFVENIQMHFGKQPPSAKPHAYDAPVERRFAVRMLDWEADFNQPSPVKQLEDASYRMLKEQLTEHRSWLNDRRAFRHVRELAQHHRFAFPLLDLCQDGQSVRQIKEGLNTISEEVRAPVVVDSIYLSNIPFMVSQTRGETLDSVRRWRKNMTMYGQHIDGTSVTNLYNNIKTLSDSKTRLVIGMPSEFSPLEFDCKEVNARALVDSVLSGLTLRQAMTASKQARSGHTQDPT